jgi:hypothetical protein
MTSIMLCGSSLGEQHHPGVDVLLHPSLVPLSAPLPASPTIHSAPLPSVAVLPPVFPLYQPSAVDEGGPEPHLRTTWPDRSGALLLQNLWDTYVQVGGLHQVLRKGREATGPVSKWVVLLCWCGAAGQFAHVCCSSGFPSAKGLQVLLVQKAGYSPTTAETRIAAWGWILQQHNP